MGILSKLFGGNKDAENKAMELLKALADAKAEEKKKAPEQKQEEAPKPQQAAAPEPEEDPGPSGFSWGERMPAEENQYNYKGTWQEYFEHIFRDDFPQYQYSADYRPGGKRVVYTLSSGGATVCIVEVMHAGSDSKKLRERCRNNGVPYTRFYHNYDGWWNTREYVVTRINQAIG